MYGLLSISIGKTFNNNKISFSYQHKLVQTLCIEIMKEAGYEFKTVLLPVWLIAYNYEFYTAFSLLLRLKVLTDWITSQNVDE